MRLLNTTESDSGGFEIEEFSGHDVQPYAILSHTWGEEEVSFQDMRSADDAAGKKGYEKIRNCCALARANGYASSAELSEAINSMYRWYQEADVCYAYLADVPSIAKLSESRWFTRGWTLQELIAPSTVIFFNSEWQNIGDKVGLQADISRITGIPSNFLLGDSLSYASVAQRMSWAANRKTTRIEDVAYCLLGIFDIYMPMLYGEGEKAFIRLQEEIMKAIGDHSLFAWRSAEYHGGILASSPAAFANSGNIVSTSSFNADSSPLATTSRGIHLSSGLAILDCTEMGKENKRLAVHLEDISLTKQDFTREQNDLSHYPLTQLYDGTSFQVVVRKNGRSISTHISGGFGTYTEPPPPQGAVVPEPEQQQEQTQKDDETDISLHDGRHVHATVQKRIPTVRDGKHLTDVVEILRDGKHLTDVVEISYAGGRPAAWLQNVALLEGDVKEKTLLSYAARRGHAAVVGLLLDTRKFTINSRDERGLTPLSLAAQKGHKEVVRLLLERGADVESPDESSNNQTLLSRAAANGHETVVRLLLERGAELESRDDDDKTPLLWAAKNGHGRMVELLRENGATDPRSKEDRDRIPPLLTTAVSSQMAAAKPLLQEYVGPRDKTGWMSLLLAAASGHEVEVKLLFEKGAYLESSGDKGNPAPSWLAAADGEDEEQLLRKWRGSIEDRSANGLTPLSWAAMYGLESIAALLLEKGADIEARSDTGQTALSWSAVFGQLATMRVLLDRGANIETRDSRGRTPLSWAAMCGKTDAVELLIGKGANVEARSDNGYTPFLWALHKEQNSTAKLLFDKGGATSIEDLAGSEMAIPGRYNSVIGFSFGFASGFADLPNFQQTPLCWAAEKGNGGGIKLLLARGADIEGRSGNGQTALSWAASYGQVGTVRMLLERGANTECRSSNGQTPLSWAATYGHRLCAQALLDAGADIEALSSSGQSPLSWAAMYGRTDMVEFLLNRGAYIDQQSINGQTPYLWALEKGHDATADLLRHMGADVSAPPCMSYLVHCLYDD
ncbi:ankyrin repeat-containing domain protein [Nemania sp. NC0429]|nr:ankyrin repeat-containing domain protein [Nemania sp. NC0429]